MIPVSLRMKWTTSINHQPTIGSYYFVPFDIYYIYVYRPVPGTAMTSLLSERARFWRVDLQKLEIIWAPGLSFGWESQRCLHVLHGKWPSKNESVQIITHSIHAPYIEYLTFTITNQPVMFINIPVPWIVWDNDSSTWKPLKISEVLFRETSIFKGKVDMDSVHESVVPARLNAGFSLWASNKIPRSLAWLFLNIWFWRKKPC